MYAREYDAAETLASINSSTKRWHQTTTAWLAPVTRNTVTYIHCVAKNANNFTFEYHSQKNQPILIILTTNPDWIIHITSSIVPPRLKNVTVLRCKTQTTFSAYDEQLKARHMLKNLFYEVV